MEEKKEMARGEQLRRSLIYEKKNGYDRIDSAEQEAMEAYCTGYKQFLDAGKTERECVDRTISLVQAAGFKAFERGMELKAGAGREHRRGPHRLPSLGSEAASAVRDG